LRSQLQVRTRRSYTERAVNVPRFEISEDRKRGGGRRRPPGRAKATGVIERSKLALKAATLAMKLQEK
jgi:predicted alpha/beta-hydrolase family hydrolase